MANVPTKKRAWTIVGIIGELLHIGLTFEQFYHFYFLSQKILWQIIYCLVLEWGSYKFGNF